MSIMQVIASVSIGEAVAIGLMIATLVVMVKK